MPFASRAIPGVPFDPEFPVMDNRLHPSSSASLGSRTVVCCRATVSSRRRSFSSRSCIALLVRFPAVNRGLQTQSPVTNCG
jgi:hypothetical protein